MRVKKLKLHGFKSFPDETELHLDADITALAGPNGCGKSNIVDAIRWVLGSQSPKTLRGNEMADMIFQGSESRNQMGFARAELTIDNEDETIPVDYSEVTIGRKLYRSGESEYLLNGEQVRLKDIKELLYDTGIGVENYSLIKQGEVGRVLNSSGEERRELLEEAAGISTFQARKQKAERDLARVEDDLEKVENDLSRLDGEIHSLKSQAGKARKYRERKEQLEEKKRELVLRRYGKYLKKEKQKYEEWQEAKDRRESLQGDMEQARNREQELTERLNEIRDKNSDLLAKEADLESKLENKKERVRDWESEIRDVRQELENLRERDLEETERRIEAFSEEIDSLQKKADRKREDLDDLEQRRTRVQARMQEYRDGIEELETDLERLDMRIEEEREEVEEGRRKIRDIRKSQDRREKEIENRKETLEDLSEKEDQLKNQREKWNQKLEEIQPERDRLTEEIHQMEEKEETKRQKRSSLETNIQECEGDIQKTNARIEHLQDLEESGAGLPDGTAEVVQKLEKGDIADQGVRGLLVDCLDFSDRGETILQGVLEPYLSYMIVEDWGTADRLLQMAREREGTLGLFVLSSVPAREDLENRFSSRQSAEKERQGDTVIKENLSIDEQPDESSPEKREQPLETMKGSEDGPGGEGFSLSRLIDGPSRITTLVRWLLSHQGIQEEIRKNGHQVKDGLTGHGAVTGEDGLVYTGKGLLHYRGRRRVQESPADRKRELVEKKEQKRDLVAKRNEYQEELETVRNNLEDLEKGLKTRRQRVYELDVKKSNLEEKKEDISREIDTIQDKMNVHKNHIETLRDDIRNAAHRKANQERLIGAAKDQIRSYREKREEIDEKLQKGKDRLASDREEKNQLDSEISGLKEKIRGFEREIELNREQKQEAQQRLKRTRERMAEKEEREEELVEHLEQGRQEVGQLKRDLSETREDLEETKERLGKLEEKRREMSEKREEIRRTYRDLQQKVQQLETDTKKHEANRENIKEQAEEDLGMDLSEIELEDQFEENTEEKIEDRKEDVRELQKELDGMGNVNLAALEQLEEKQDEADDIREQKEDLTTSRKRLQRIIRKMKRKSEDRLKETIEQGSENFNQLFRKLFGGGKATIEVVYDEEEEEDNHDLLDCEIEIYARPPGQEKLPISSLSGGEQAMTSIAFMMGLFMLNPGAICILDEADAPLDDSNLDLFIGMLEEFTDLTQFLIVTHKKKTLTAAERVYGMTMQEDGVSNMVTLDLEKRIPEEYLEQDQSDNGGGEKDRVNGGIGASSREELTSSKKE